MSTLSIHSAPSLGMEKLWDNYAPAERGEGAGCEEAGGSATFMVEDGGIISYAGIFLDDKEDSDDETSDSSTDAEVVMAHLHAAFGGVGAPQANSIFNTSSGSGSTSTSGSTASIAPVSDGKGEEWKNAVLESLEDFLQTEGGIPAAGAGANRRFSFDLSNLDMQTLEQLAAGTTSGSSSRRGSFSLTLLEAEGFMTKSPPASSMAPLLSSGARFHSVPDNLPAGFSHTQEGCKEHVVCDCKKTLTTALGEDGAGHSVPNASVSASKNTGTGASCALEPLTKPQVKKGFAAASTPTGESSPDAPAASVSAASLLPTSQTPPKMPDPGDGPDNKTGANSSGTGSTDSMGTSGTPNGNGGMLVLPVIPKDGVARIGIYTLEERKLRVARFQAKRGRRIWRKKIKYDCRKKLADNRPRVKGRFVRRDEEIDIIVGGAVAAAEAAAAGGSANGSSSALLTQLMDLDELLED